MPSAATSAIGYGRFHGSGTVHQSPLKLPPATWPEHSSRWPTRIARGEAVPVVARPAVLVDQRREEERGVGDPAGDHDVGALRERVGDRERAEVRGEEQRVGAHRGERRAGLDVRERATPVAARTSSRRGMRSSPITVAIFSPDAPAARAVSIAACAAARGLMPPALVMTFVRPVEHRRQRGAEVAREVARVAERLVARAVLLQDRERQLRERLEAEVVDAVLEQPGDRARRVAVEALAAADADRTGSAMGRRRGGATSRASARRARRPGAGGPRGPARR